MTESLLHLFKALERSSREFIEPVITCALETRREHTTQEQVIVRVSHHLVLVLMEMLDGVGRSRAALEARHHELFRETVRSDILRERRVESGLTYKAPSPFFSNITNNSSYGLNCSSSDIIFLIFCDVNFKFLGALFSTNFIDIFIVFSKKL